MKKQRFYFLVIVITTVVLILTVAGCSRGSRPKNSFEDIYNAVSWYEDVLGSSDTSSKEPKDEDEAVKESGSSSEEDISDDIEATTSAPIDEETDAIAQENNSEETSKTDLSNNQKFVIVIPARCGAELFYGAAFLSEELSKYVANEVEVVYDCDFKKSSGKTAIFVGATEHEKSIKYLKDLRVNDYGYEYNEGILLIGAHRETLCIEAINTFVADVKNGKIDIGQLYKIAPYTSRGEYHVSEIKLCEFPIEEYDIVYPEKNLMDEMVLAEILRDKLSEYSGYCLRVISDKQCTDATRAICVGKSSVTFTEALQGTAYVSLNSDGNIELVSDKNAGIYCAIENFIDMIKQSEIHGKCDVELRGQKKYLYDGAGISFYIVRDDFERGSFEVYANVVRNIRNSSISVFDSLSSTVKTNIFNNLGRLDDVNENSFYYIDNQNVRCISSQSKLFEGGGEILTLVMERADGKQFVFVGGFCQENAEAADDEKFLDRLTEECQKYAELPLVVAHEMSASLDAKFAETNMCFITVSDADGIYFSTGRLALVSASKPFLADSAFADVLTLEFYYK